MRIKRTYAATMREALAQVKLEQGPDAVILGNKKVPGGVEILSAVDFDHRRADAYSGSPDQSVSSSSQPPVQSTPLSVPAARAVSSDIQGMPDFILQQTAGERKEPVLGIEDSAASARAQAQAVQSQARSSAIPQANARPESARPRPVVDYSQTEQSLRRKMLPVEEELKARQSESKQQESGQFTRDQSPNQFNQQHELSQPRSRYDSSPAIDEVKDELKNLRNLMQSQLSIMGWDRYSDVHPVRTVLLGLMNELGLGTDITEMIFTQIGKFQDEPHKVWQQALGLLARAIPIADSDMLNNGGRIALVGSTGVGKTTTIAKLAARFTHAHGKHSVALITTDNFRIGAHEQLQHFARMLEIPLLTANSSEELSDRLKMLTDKKLVLIDTAGMSQSDVRLSEQFHKLQHGSPEIQPYLVLSANTQLAALNETIKSFSKVKLAGAIVTKLDESACLGGIITTAIRHKLALTYCATGQRVPEDLQVAKNHRLVSKAVALMQQYGEQSGKEVMALRYNHIISNHSV